MHPNFYGTCVGSVTHALKGVNTEGRVNVVGKSMLKVCYSVNGVVRSEAMPSGQALSRAYALAKIYTKVWTENSKGDTVQIGSMSLAR